MRGEGCREITLDRKSLPSHKCSFCSHSTRYPEVLWMHKTVAHRINSSSSNLAPKWAVKNSFKSSKDNSLASKRRTGPPPVLEGKECSPLPPVMRAQRTRPPAQSSEVLKKSKPASHGAQPPSSAPSSSSSGFRGSSAASGSQGGRAPVRPSKSRGGVRHAEDPTQQPRVRPKADPHPRAGSGSSEKTAAAFSRSSTPSPASSTTPRVTERYLMPHEGLGFMLSSKHGLAEYGRARGFPHQPLSHSLSQGRSNAPRPGAVGHSSPAGHPHGASSSTSLLSEQRGDVKQETIAEMPDVPTDILGYLKNYSPHELAALYHRWGATNAMLDPTGRGRQSGRHAKLCGRVWEGARGHAVCARVCGSRLASVSSLPDEPSEPFRSQLRPDHRAAQMRAELQQNGAGRAESVRERWNNYPHQLLWKWSLQTTHVIWHFSVPCVCVCL